MSATNSQQELTLTIICGQKDEVSIVFYAVPQLAADQVGEIRIDWGDGRVNAVDCTISDGALTEMVNSPDKEALVESRHSYAATGKRTVKISSASGFLPLKSLPTQTVSIDSSLPVLTQGETDDKNQLIASDTLGRLVADNPESGQCTLSSICPELLANNPQLAFFDDAFAHSAISIVPPRLFAGCRKLSSLVRTFADSAVTQIPAGFLANADQSTICEETFAHCHALESIESPFKAGVLPVCMENFLLEAPSTFFSWCDPDRREEMGWVRPEAQSTDPSFDFEWMPTMVGVAEQLAVFYLIDLELKGDLLVDWGDGNIERIDWNKVDALEHAYAAVKPYRVCIHTTPREAVRPFQLGAHVRRIFTPLPVLHPRSVGLRGDFCGWAANRRELVELPPSMFINNPHITNLEQAFAGCVKLENVPDNVLEGLKNVAVDGMFAFCKSMLGLPASYRSMPRDKTLDYFSIS